VNVPVVGVSVPLLLVVTTTVLVADEPHATRTSVRSTAMTGSRVAGSFTPWPP